MVRVKADGFKVAENFKKTAKRFLLKWRHDKRREGNNKATKTPGLDNNN